MLIINSLVLSDDTTQASGRITRSASSQSLATMPSTSAGTKRLPGRPSRSSLLSQPESTAASTSAEVTSPSDYSTAVTSVEPTPAPSVIAGASTGPKKATGTSIEVQIPAMERAPSARATRNGRYSMKPASKRRNVITIKDSDEDEDDVDEEVLFAAPSAKSTRRGRYSLNTAAKKRAAIVPDSDEEDLSDLNPDERLARKLQEEEYRATDLAPSRLVLPQRGAAGNTQAKIAAAASTFIQGTKRKRGRPSKSEQQPPQKIIRADDQDSTSALSTLDFDSFIEDSDEDEEFLASESSNDEALSTRPRNLVKKTPAQRSAAPTPGGSVIDSAIDQALYDEDDSSDLDSEEDDLARAVRVAGRNRRGFHGGTSRRGRVERNRLLTHHPILLTMWDDLKKMPTLKAGKAAQPHNITRQLKPFQLEGLAWMKEMEKSKWKGGLLGDEMGLGKTIQAVSLIMSDFPAKKPTLVLVPPVALMQWTSEIASYTEGALKTFVFHGTNAKTKGMTVRQLKEHNVIMMSYNSLESMYRKQEKGFKRKDAVHKEKSLIHQIHFHRVILDEAHCIKTRSTMTAKACFALKVDYRWCLSGTPLQNRIGEFFSLIRFLNIDPFASYLCKSCPCSSLEWELDEHSRCTKCNHTGLQHTAVFNQELLNPIQKYGSMGPGREAFDKLRLLTDKIMLRRLKKDHSSSMDLPVKEIHVDRQFFGEIENDFANSIMTNSKRKFETYVAQGVLLNNYANIFGLIMQMRQVANHPDLILKKSADGGQNILVCCICDEPAEEAIRSRCKHDFCRECAKGYLLSSDQPDCPQCHIPLSIDLEQPEIEQDNTLVKKSSIINRIKMENWTSSSKIELLVRDLHRLRSDKASHKSIIFSQFTSMLQLIEWRLRRAGLTTVMLDGSMTPAQRQASIDHFMNTPEVECFLVSLKAGGVALNLTEASRVFIVDP